MGIKRGASYAPPRKGEKRMKEMDDFKGRFEAAMRDLDKLDNGAYTMQSEQGEALVSEAGTYLALFSMYLRGETNPNVTEFCEWVLMDLLPSLTENHVYVLDGSVDLEVLKPFRMTKAMRRGEKK